MAVAPKYMRKIYVDIGLGDRYYRSPNVNLRVIRMKLRCIPDANLV